MLSDTEMQTERQCQEVYRSPFRRHGVWSLCRVDGPELLIGSIERRDVQRMVDPFDIFELLFSDNIS
jgi:hypothetical protein